MRIEIVGTESLGVRGLCCAVHTRHRHVLIDPGLALGYLRNGQLPHPRQVAAGVAVARRIMAHLAKATDVVFSHYHGDHVPLSAANPFQLPLSEAGPLLRRPRLWGKDPSDAPPKFAARCRDIETAAGQPIFFCDGRQEGCFTFSRPMPHGHQDSGMGWVMMTRIEDEGEVFVHASDIQLLDDAPVSVIEGWRPGVVLTSGPPLYRDMTSEQLAAPRRRALQIAQIASCCVIDHHLLRSRAGLEWLDGLGRETGGVIRCAADYMKADRRLLEADRRVLYEREPVPPGWHEAYRRPPLYR